MSSGRACGYLGQAAFWVALILMRSAAGAVQEPGSGPPVPAVPQAELPDPLTLRTQVLETGRSLGWALLLVDGNRGLYAWKANLTGPHPTIPCRVVCQFKRIGDEVGFTATYLVYQPRHVSPAIRDGSVQEVSLMDEFFQERFTELTGLTPAAEFDESESLQNLTDFVLQTMRTKWEPVAAGDMISVVGRHPTFLLNGKPAAAPIRGSVLEVIGLTEGGVRVSNRRLGVLAEGDVSLLPQAVELYSREIESAPMESAGYLRRGMALSFLPGHQLEGLADLDRAVELAPENAHAWHFRGIALSYLGRKDLALASLNQALWLDPNLVEAWFDRAVVNYQQGRHRVALTNLNTALRRDAKYARAFGLRANVNEQTGAISEAMADFARAIELDPDYGEYYFNRALGHLHLDNAAEATRDFKQAGRLEFRYRSFLHNPDAWLSPPEKQPGPSELPPGFSIRLFRN